ncbi:PREDICTED: uncharacterized protein LOC104736229 [Camelina sativa]|uniref:Uncharacterized protein LOC104736229 n=1 Tax=Camelina sativa TaxID=90675 RepID=A0ABM0VDB7_CAMSA|nr:PREDICTED: uncharacterized protein LOC104736229 [Camelina sativa]
MWYSTFTILLVVAITSIFLSNSHCHVNFSVESISVTPSASATWLHVVFLVENPSSLSRCLVYYNGHNVQAMLGSFNAAVLNTSSRDDDDPSGRHTSFSVKLATAGNQSHVVAASSPRGFALELKLRAKKDDLIGHYDIRCQNLNIGYDKIKCHSSSFKIFKQFF